MSDDQEIRVTLELQEDYAFRVQFDGEALEDLHTDEPAPLGSGSGPNPSRLLLVAVANCLSASLLFALRKFRNQPGGLRTRARTALARDGNGRWRIPRVEVELELAESAEAHQQLQRILEQFEQFCVVTQSVRQGIAVDVRVRDASGRLLLGQEATGAA